MKIHKVGRPQETFLILDVLNSVAEAIGHLQAQIDAKEHSDSIQLRQQTLVVIDLIDRDFKRLTELVDWTEIPF